MSESIRFAGLEPGADTTLVEVLDRLLDHGVYVGGDLTLSVAEVDLVWVGVKLVLGSVDRIAWNRSAAA